MIYQMIFKKRFFIFLIFLLILIAFSTIWFMAFDNFISTKEKILPILNNINPEFLKTFNIDPDISFTPLGYYIIGLNIYLIIYILYAAFLAIKTMLGEVIYENTLITMPLSKTKYLRNKILISLFYLLITNIIMLIIMIIIMALLKDLQFSKLFFIQLSLFISQLAIFSLILMISTFITNIKVTNVTTIIIILVLYILMCVYKMTDFKPLAYINPLCYFNYLNLLLKPKLELDYLVAFIILSFFAINFTFKEYELRGENNV